MLRATQPPSAMSSKTVPEGDQTRFTMSTCTAKQVCEPVGTFRAAAAIVAVLVTRLAGRRVLARVLTGTAAFGVLHVVRTLVICGHHLCECRLRYNPALQIGLKSYGRRFRSSILGASHRHRRTVWRTLRWFCRVRRRGCFQWRRCPSYRFY